ncbi:SDR family NAD(P)-dependent oxidoreductase [Candidatus Poriferisocius sp.]|uniref:SDR family NAD(P)-dependent oxidoreductase n=1 Tax=Candidatus Poriferisocius sp. TaxID=3101276 RepID=UPI003B522767
MKELKGKVAVVTGAASGIGLALTKKFVSEGMPVVMADVEEEALAASATQLGAEGADVLGVLCDVSDASSVQDLAEQTLSSYGGVHVVCNNAGVGPAGMMLETTPEEWEWIVGVNVMGVAHGVITFAPLMVEAGEGHIVNTASEAGLVTNGLLGMYCATKHAVVGLTESLWREVHPQGVGVSCLCPNLVNTRIFHSERNRPYGAELTATQNAIITPLRETLSARGIAPSDVAAKVVDAITEDRFWVFTHDITPEAAAVRFTDIEARRNPTDPYAGMEF